MAHIDGFGDGVVAAGDDEIAFDVDVAVVEEADGADVECYRYC